MMIVGWMHLMILTLKMGLVGVIYISCCMQVLVVSIKYGVCIAMRGYLSSSNSFLTM